MNIRYIIQIGPTYIFTTYHRLKVEKVILFNGWILAGVALILSKDE